MLDTHHNRQTLSAVVLDLCQVLRYGIVLSGDLIAMGSAGCAEHAGCRLCLLSDAALGQRLFRTWAKRKMTRSEAGMGSLAIVLLQAGTAELQCESLVELEVAYGVTGGTITKGCDPVITLNKRETPCPVQLNLLKQPDGSIFVAQATLGQIREGFIEDDYTCGCLAYIVDCWLSRSASGWGRLLSECYARSTHRLCAKAAIRCERLSSRSYTAAIFVRQHSLDNRKRLTHVK